MKLGIMQPYFLPYIGYWQLLAIADKYVVYDDVNFIKGGWINRNRILVQGKPQYINVQMVGSSSFKYIKDVGVDSSERWRRKLLDTIKMAYAKAPYYDEIYPLMKRLICKQENSLAKYLFEIMCEIAEYLDVDTQLVLSSEIDQDRSLHAEARVIDICRRMGATEYVNAIGGRKLYSASDFAKDGIRLLFLQTNVKPYHQFNDKYISNLSILDVLMFNGKKRTQEMLKEYVLIDDVKKVTI